jgi:DNA-binding NarL/FixJ family response regulator
VSTDLPVPLRIMVVEDHPMVREAIVDALAAEADMQVVGEAADGKAAVAEALRLCPDVIIMDLLLPVQGGVEAILQIKAQIPNSKILALTSATDEALFLAALQAGATGYLVKDSERSALLSAVREVARGNTSISPRMVAKLVAHLSRQTGGQSDQLSEREREILRLIGSGRTNQEIAQLLQVSGSTVRTHLQHILDKLGLENRNQAVLYAIRIGLATPPG